MATPKLDEYAKLVNEVLRYKLKLKTIPTKDFLQDKESYSKIVEDVYSIEGFKLPNNVPAEDISFQLMCLMYTEDFFDLDFSESKQLLWDLTSYEYYKVMSTLDNDEFDIHWGGESYETSIAYYEIETPKGDYELFKVDYLKSQLDKYNKWQEYCKFLDEAKFYIQELHPDYTKYNKKEKLDFINKLSRSSFTKDIANLLDDYNLNQFKQAKAVKLLSLNLPNITDLQIANKLTDLYIQQNS